ncbi:MAG: NHLP bacteriocin system secretion protein [Gammaproteobacteria bacterium]|nr:NHLP bacteriocin system secretion protein [Gammaproteobacteria bacterium]
MQQKLFRKAALERLSTPDQLDDAMQITTPMGWLALLALFMVVTGGVVWSVVGSAQIKVPGQGILIHPGGVLDVVSPVSGPLAALLVRPGSRVTEGTVVGRVSQPDLEQQILEAQLALAELRLEREALESLHRAELESETAYSRERLAQIAETRQFLSERLLALEEQYRNVELLWERRVIVRRQLIDAELEVNRTRQELAALDAELLILEKDATSSASRRTRESRDRDHAIASAERALAALVERRDRVTTIRSPYAGTVAEQKVNVGEQVVTGMPLFSLLPDDSAVAAVGSETWQPAPDRLVGVVYVSPVEGKGIRPGMRVEVDPTTVRREEFGTLRGIVREVAEVPSTTEGMMRILRNTGLVTALAGDTAPFQVTVELLIDPSTVSGYAWTSGGGPDQRLNPGTLAQAEVVTSEVRLIGLVIPALRRMLTRDVIAEAVTLAPDMGH